MKPTVVSADVLFEDHRTQLRWEWIAGLGASERRFDEVAIHAPSLAAELFDTGINMGTGTATAFLQRALNALNREGRDYADLTVDRQIGPSTLAALQAFLRKRGTGGEAVLLKAVEALQGAHYINIAEARPSQEAFVYGWLANRIGDAAPS